MRLQLDRLEWACLAFAVVVAHALLWHEWHYPSYYDAHTYQVIASEMVRDGLFSKWTLSDLRTYGYPFFLSLVRRAADAVHLDFRIALFGLQFSLHVAACLFLRSELARLWPHAARIVFCGLMLDFYVLVFPSASLTESLTITLTLFAAACWLRVYGRGADWGALLAGSLAAGFAVMVRPANIFLAAAWAFAVLLAGWRGRPGTTRSAIALACVAAGLALPMLPQLANNVMHYDKATPLVVAPLREAAQYWGIRNIKYATAMPPVPEAAIGYANPFVEGTALDPDRPLRWYAENPGRGLLTIALHTFNMLDQDLFFTYSRDLEPWYRLPLGVINHAILALGLIGLALLGRRALTGPPRVRDPWLALVVLLGANWAVYATSMVEMRFGSVLLLALFPLAGFALSRGWAHRGERRVDVMGAAVIAFVAAALALSGWVRDQSDLIRQARMARHAGLAPPQLATVPGAAQGDRVKADAELARVGVESQLGRRGGSGNMDLHG